MSWSLRTKACRAQGSGAGADPRNRAAGQPTWKRVPFTGIVFAGVPRLGGPCSCMAGLLEADGFRGSSG